MQRSIVRLPLIERIRLSSNARLVFVHAPAGFGKSTFLRQVRADREDQGWRCAWINFNAHDADPHRFLALVERACRDLPSAATPTEGPINPLDVFSAVAGPTCLFLDDFEAVANDEIDAFLGHMLRRLPADKQILLACRSAPPAFVSRFLVRNEAMVVTASDLRFDLANTYDFLSQHEELSLNDVRAIHEDTGGWPAALQFVSLALARGRLHLRQHGAHGLTAELTDYMLSEIVACLPDDTRKFLLDTCLPESLTAELVQAIAGVENGSDALRRIADQGLFLDATDCERIAYRYHAIFREILQREARKAMSGEALRRRHRHLLDQAVTHALAAGDVENAASLLESAVDGLVREERLGLIVSLVEQLPPDTLWKSPKILGAAIIAYGFRRAFDRAHALLEWRRRTLETDPASTPRQWGEYHCYRAFVYAAQDRIDELSQASQESLNLLTDSDSFASAVAMNGRAFCLAAQSQFHEAHDLLLRASSLHDQAGSWFGQSYQESIAASALVSQARLGEAIKSLKRAHQSFSHATSRGAAAGAVISAFLGEALYETNQIDDAERIISANLPLIEQQCIVDPLAAAYVALARIALLRGARDLAAELRDRLIQLGFSFGLTRLVRYGRAEIVRQFVLDGDLEAAGGLLDTLGAEDQSTAAARRYFHSGEIEAQRVTHARYFIYAERYAEARAMLKTEIRAAETARRWRRHIRLNTLLAICLDRENEPNAARRIMISALRMAEPGKFRRIFLDEGPAAVKLLRDIAAENIAADSQWNQDTLSGYLHSLLSDAGVEGVDAHERPIVGAGQTLTERERDLLLLIASGYSNAALADRLSVSANTVKWHLRNVYQKLGIRNRMQAVHAARYLGLIP
jgi:LuxR family maltose regulon positive regulatory protein